jgi:O-antigen ligase
MPTDATEGKTAWPRHGGGTTRPYSRVQGVIGWTCLFLTLGLALLFGGNSTVYWFPFAFLVSGLFFAQAILVGLRGGHPASRRLVAPACLFAGTLVWGAFQTMTGLPSGWGHPFWDLAPEAAPRLSATPIATAQSVFLLSIYAMIFWIAAEAGTNPRRALRFFQSISVFSAGLAAFGLYASVSGGNAMLGSQASSNVSATFVNRNAYALYAGFGLIVNMALYFDMTGWGNVHGEAHDYSIVDILEDFFSGAWVFLFGAVLCLSALVLTASRAGIASSLVGLAVLLLGLTRHSRGSRRMLISASMLLGALVIILSGDVLMRLGSSDHEIRFTVYRELLTQIFDRLFLGNGFGSFEHTFRPHLPFEAAARDWSLAHNTYLENLWEMGLPAAAAFYAALAWIGLVIVRGVLSRRRNRHFPAAALACVVAGGLHSTVDFSLQMPATSALFAFILGIGWAHAWPDPDTAQRMGTRG